MQRIPPQRNVSKNKHAWKSEIKIKQNFPKVLSFLHPQGVKLISSTAKSHASSCSCLTPASSFSGCESKARTRRRHVFKTQRSATTACGLWWMTMCSKDGNTIHSAELSPKSWSHQETPSPHQRWVTKWTDCTSHLCLRSMKSYPRRQTKENQEPLQKCIFLVYPACLKQKYNTKQWQWKQRTRNTPKTRLCNLSVGSKTIFK